MQTTLKLLSGSNGLILAAFPFNVYVDASIIRVQPSTASTDGGCMVSVFGKNFLDGNVKVSLGGMTAVGSFVSTSVITFLTPAHETGPVHIQVANNGADFSSNT
eukprot:659638-Rhodomonas_salina.1